MSPVFGLGDVSVAGLVLPRHLAVLRTCLLSSCGSTTAGQSTLNKALDSLSMLLCVCSDLQPLAIQLEVPSPRIYLPDHTWVWTLAKLHTLAADAATEQLGRHLLEVHLAAEVIAIAAARESPTDVNQ